MCEDGVLGEGSIYGDDATWVARIRKWLEETEVEIDEHDLETTCDWTTVDRSDIRSNVV